MDYFGIVLIYLTIGPSYGVEYMPYARPVPWLFGSPVANDNRYYIEPLRKNEDSTVADGFECIPVLQLATEPKDSPISDVWVHGIDGQTNKQTTYVATAHADDPNQECFSSIDPPSDVALRELNGICNTVGFRVLNTSDPYVLKDGTYSGNKDSSMGLKADVKSGKIKRLTTHDLMESRNDELYYFGVGHVISVIVGNHMNSNRNDTLILEPEVRELPLEYDAITWENLGSWDHDESRYEDINENGGHEKGSGKRLGRVRKMVRGVKRRVHALGAKNYNRLE